MRTDRLLPVILSVITWCALAAAATPERQLTQKIDAYILPYVDTANFSGNVLLKKDGRVLFQKTYGLADRERQTANTKSTRFHIASISMQFTSAAILRLIDEGSLTLDTHVGEFVHGIPGAEQITIRDLLMERSGLPDINNLPDYNDILQQHQTPATLVGKIQGQSLLFEPGSKYLHEEHSAFNLLALIIEKKTGMPFRAAVQKLVLQPAGLKDSGADDDSDLGPDTAIGYAPEGTYGLKRAETIHWSAKTGNASIYTTVGDEDRFVDAFLSGRFLSSSSRKAALDASERVGYGWFKSENRRFNEMAYYMNGRAPGFASFVLHLPRENMTVVVLSNIYASVTTTIGNDVAAITLNLPYTSFKPGRRLSADELKASAGAFQFGPDFYQANAKLILAPSGNELSLQWPSGSSSFLIPLGRDRFVDRSYWEEVRIERDQAGRPAALGYGSFRGSAVKATPQ